MSEELLAKYRSHDEVPLVLCNDLYLQVFFQAKERMHRYKNYPNRLRSHVGILNLKVLFVIQTVWNNHAQVVIRMFTR